MKRENNIYISSSCIEGNHIGEIVKLLAECGIRNIELSGGSKYYAGWFDDLEKLQNEYDLRYVFHAYFPPREKDIVINLAAEGNYGDESLEYYLLNLEYMKRLHCDTLSIHAGFFVDFSPESIGKTIENRHLNDRIQSIYRFVERYKRLKSIADSYNIKVLIENNVLSKSNLISMKNTIPFMLVNYDDYLEMKQCTDFDLLLDIGHLNVSCNSLGLSLYEELDKWCNSPKWLHVSHNDGVEDQHEVLVPNSIISKALDDYFFYDIPITIECHGSLNDVLNCYRNILMARGGLKNE